MSTFAVIALCLLSAQVGFLVGWFVMEKVFYQPLRKNFKEAIKGWGQAIDMCIELARLTGTPIKKEDGSILSPIQMKRSDEK